MSLDEIIKKNRPNLSMSSLKGYMSSLRTVSKAINKPINTLDDIIENEHLIFDSTSKNKLNSRKTKLSAFIVALDAKGRGKNNDNIEKILNKFRTQITLDGEKHQEDELKQELTDSQKKNYIPWDEVEKIYENLKIEAEPLFKLPRLNLAQFNKLQNYVLLSMYVLIPPRRSMDYSMFKLRKIDEKEDNYLTIKGKKKVATMVFNKYKNSGRLGAQNVIVPNILRNIILKWREKNPFEYLIVNNKGEHIGQSKINQILNNIFGKNISSSLLRHIYLTSKFGNVDLQNITDVTKAMGNSEIQRTLSYVSKEHK